MISFLEDGKKAKVDDGYVGEPTKTLTPKLNTHMPADPEL